MFDECSCEYCSFIEIGTENCQLVTAFRSYRPRYDLRERWHAYLPCPDQCSVCNCSCRHCWFGVDKACTGTGLVKNVESGGVWYPKSDLQMSVEHTMYLDWYFQLAEDAYANEHLLCLISNVAPLFTILSDDHGLSVTDIIKQGVPESTDRDRLLFEITCT